MRLESVDLLIILHRVLQAGPAGRLALIPLAFKQAQLLIDDLRWRMLLLHVVIFFEVLSLPVLGGRGDTSRLMGQRLLCVPDAMLLYQ